MVRSMDKYLTQTREELYRAQARIIMIDRHIEPMGNMGFFNEEIIYGAVEHMAPAEFLPHPSGYYKQMTNTRSRTTALEEEILRQILPNQAQMLQDKPVAVDQLFLMTTLT
ncbi:hypothetical protein E2562_038519 [Oryza meyeriana var. granulata]|uniref:Uncharacterized protein n=1 Tax=Oryza meyeriana var. granulata TaxID=110450 RepID=A0A6G1CKN2_9ORYZ|nr:hypothetical protein E2562_038519 [Oryza meyeriana var. granulata]